MNAIAPAALHEPGSENPAAILPQSPPAKPRAAAGAALQDVLMHPGIWRRSASVRPHVRALSTGLPGLDALLPGGGWPCGALTEILFACDGVGELSLLMPALAELTRRQQRVVFVAPPYIPYAPALEAHGLDLRHVVQIESTVTQGAWSAEQCLRSGSCGAVLGWLHQADYTQLRRLQLAAESGDALAFLFRPAQVAAKPSPAAVRLQLHAGFDGGDPGPDSGADAAFVDIEVLKCRGNPDWQRPTRLRWSRLQHALP